MNKKKKQILILVCLLVLIIIAILFLFLQNNGDTYSTEYKESEREDTVLCGGTEYQYNDHLSNYLFMGIDTRDPVEEGETREANGRADAIFLVSYDRVKKTVKCISIPRDTITNIHTFSVDGDDLGLTEDHITMQYMYGDGKDKSCRLMKETVSNLMYGVPIQGYCSVNMDGIPTAVKVLGEVNLVVPDDTLEKADPKFKKGAQVAITAEDAELFVRYRDTQQSQSAIARMNRQKVFMEAFVEEAKVKALDNTDLVVDMYEDLKPYMVTNMGTDLFAQLLDATYDSKDKIQDIPGEKVDGMQFDEYHINGTELYEFILQNFYKEVQDD